MQICSVTQTILAVCGAIAGLCFAIGQIPTASAAEREERLAVTDIKPLLVGAVERGDAHGVLNGPGADYVQRRFDTQTPIEVDVRRLHTLSQTGCARLEVTTRQREVQEGSTRKDGALTYQISFCRDGRFPDKR